MSVHSGIEFLLVLDIQSANGRVCEAVALLPHSAEMNLSKLARTLPTGWRPARIEACRQSADALDPGVISKERLRRA